MSNKSYLSIYAKSFNWAGFFLPKRVYLKCSALYDFCRTIDNIADEDGELEVILRDVKTEEIYDVTKRLHVNDTHLEKIVFVSREKDEEDA